MTRANAQELRELGVKDSKDMSFAQRAKFEPAIQTRVRICTFFHLCCLSVKAFSLCHFIVLSGEEKCLDGPFCILNALCDVLFPKYSFRSNWRTHSWLILLFPSKWYETLKWNVCEFASGALLRSHLGWSTSNWRDARKGDEPQRHWAVRSPHSSYRVHTVHHMHRTVDISFVFILRMCILLPTEIVSREHLEEQAVM